MQTNELTLGPLASKEATIELINILNLAAYGQSLCK